MFNLRLILDFAAVGLLLAGLAYWWLDNRTHEMIGTAMFLLIIAHNVFNRRWHGAIRQGRYDARRRLNTAVILLLAIAMLVLLITSLLLSRDLFGFLGLNGGISAREAHMVAAYWALLIVSVHLGTRWQRVMNRFGIRYGGAIESVVLAWFARLLAIGFAAYGAHSAWVMDFGSKLILRYTLDMWDFSEATAGFFLNYASIVGLFTCLTHYGLKTLQYLKRRNGLSPSRLVT